MKCPGRYYNGPKKRFVRCNVCSDVDYEANEGDRCKNPKDLDPLRKPHGGRCTCDDFCEGPCPQHGWGSIQCDKCGAAIDAPLTVLDCMLLSCPNCEEIYIGTEDEAYGFWSRFNTQDGTITRREE